MSTATVAIIAAAIGAGGAVAAQVTTAVATAKRERSRLAWEKDRQDREWKLREEERWLSEKRELYASFGAAVNEFLTYISMWLNAPDLSQPELPDREALDRIKSNIELMAPEEVYRSANFCVASIMTAVWYVRIGGVSEDELKGYYEAASSAWRNVHQVMRRDLLGDRQRLNLPVPKKADRPPEELPRHKWLWWRREAETTDLFGVTKDLPGSGRRGPPASVGHAHRTVEGSEVGGPVRCDGRAVGQQLAGVFEGHDAVAEQALALLGVADDGVRRFAVRF